MHKVLAITALLALLLPISATAKLYKCKDANGEIIYTDQPCEGEGEELKLPPTSTYTSPIIVPPSSPAIPETDEAAGYTRFEVIKPKQDAIIRTFTGTLVVGFRLEGPLKTLQGHKFAVAIDGKKLSSRGVTNQIRLNNVEIGTHTVQVFVMDKNDKPVKSTEAVTFHVRRGAQDRQAPAVPGDELPPGVPSIPGRGNTIPGSPETIPGGEVLQPPPVLPQVPGNAP